MSEEIERSADLIEHLLGDPELRRRFRADPASVLREHGLLELAEGLGRGRRALMTLELRESRSSLAGVMVAAAAEGVDFTHIAERAAPGLEREAARAVDRVLNPPAHHPASAVPATPRAPRRRRRRRRRSPASARASAPRRWPPAPRPSPPLGTRPRLRRRYRRAHRQSGPRPRAVHMRRPPHHRRPQALRPRRDKRRQRRDRGRHRRDRGLHTPGRAPPVPRLTRTGTAKLRLPSITRPPPTSPGIPSPTPATAPRRSSSQRGWARTHSARGCRLSCR